MRRRVTMLAALALLGGCAQSQPPQDVGVTRSGTRQALPRKVVNCSTIDLGLATTSHCGAGFFNPLSAAGE